MDGDQGLCMAGGEFPDCGTSAEGTLHEYLSEAGPSCGVDAEQRGNLSRGHATAHELLEQERERCTMRALEGSAERQEAGWKTKMVTGSTRMQYTNQRREERVQVPRRAPSTSAEAI